MKAQKIILGLLFVGLFFSSCSKNDDELDTIEAIPQYPIKTLIENGYMYVTYEKVNWVNTFEMGYKFKSFKNGKITALGIRVPNNKSYRVTLWNAETEEVIITKNIVSSSGLLSFEDIEPILINSGTSYFVSINTNDYYQFSNSGDDIFPVEVNDLLITGYGSTFGSGQIFPTQFTATAFLGMVDIKFVPNN